MHLTKHHALENDFLVTFVDEVPDNASELARALCHRHLGIGADGLIFGIDSGSLPEFHLRNSDGSFAEISGNGLRCFLQALAMRRSVPSLETTVLTGAGSLRCALLPGPSAVEVLASTEMGTVSRGDAPIQDGLVELVNEAIPISNWDVGAVGNPHVVFETDDLELVPLEALGPQIERFFPHGVNAHFVRRTGPNAIEMRIWERGAGVTRACGSGATVAARRMVDWGRVSSVVAVSMAGGTAQVDLGTTPESPATLSGPSVFIGAIEAPHGI